MNSINNFETKTETGRVSEIQKNSFMVRTETGEYFCKLKGVFYKGDRELPVVGDRVLFEKNEQGDSVICEVLPRKSVLKRPDMAGHTSIYTKTVKEQVMVSNFDYVFIIASLNGNYNYNRIARYVSITLQGNGIPVVILTKLDLCDDPKPFLTELKELSADLRVHAISSRQGIGLEELIEYIQPDKTIAVLGSSGVGKSTLVNALAGEEVMKTSEIRDKDDKGRHTTTYRQMIILKNGCTIIDTPGMRELGMCDVEEGIQETFADIVELEACCRFRDCTHTREPGCAVREAIRNGNLDAKRFKLYQSLNAESNKTAKMKEIALQRKSLNKNRRSSGRS